MLLDLDAIFDPDRRAQPCEGVNSPADLPADWHVLWDERAAIMEYEGGLARELAEHLALLEVLKEMNSQRPAG